MLSHTHLGTCGSGSEIICHSLFQESRKTKDEASNATKTQMSRRSQRGARTAPSSSTSRACSRPRTSPCPGCPRPQCQLPVRTQGPRRPELSHAGRRSAGPCPRVCRKGAGGAAGWREEAAFQANWRQSGKLPESPARTAGRARVIRSGLRDLRKAQRPLASKGGGRWPHASLHLCALTGD